jgi:hypothetical protein
MRPGRSGFARFTRPTVKALAPAALALVLIGPNALAQNTAASVNRAPSADGASPYPSSDTDKRPYDKHDLSGLWSRNSQQFKLPPCPECREHGPIPGYGFHGTPPPRTPEGEKRFQANKPSRGYEIGSKEAREHPEIDVGMRRAVPPALGNDPQAQCNPLGAPRLVTFSGGGASIEIIQLKDRLIQRFEWTWDQRELWMDGRKLPVVGDYLPRYNGYSVAKWEGDTLAVTTNGFDDRAWIDHYGYPMSDQMVFEERYKRISPNRLQLDMTITDPMIYKEPWHSDTKIFALILKENMSVGGWSGLLEDRCIPADESKFNKFRDVAGGKK